MRRLFFCSAAVWLGACANTFPAPVIPRTAAEEWPDVGVVVLDDVATLEYFDAQVGGRERLAARLTHRRRLKIVGEAGLRAAAVELRSDAFSRVEHIEARSVTAEGVMQNLASSAVDEGPWPEATGAEELRRWSFTVPGASVGGLVEYSYEKLFSEPHLIPPWVFADAAPVVRAELSVIVPRGVKVDLRYGVGEQPLLKAPLQQQLPDGGEKLTYVEMDLPPLFDEPNMPHPMRQRPWVAAVPTLYRSADGRTERVETWDDAVARLRTMLELPEAAPGIGPAHERYASVQAETVALAAPGVGVRTPRSAKELATGSPACSRDAATLLLARLAGSGMPAYPALLESPTGPMVLPDLPGLYGFERVVVAVDAADFVLRDPSCKADRFDQDVLCGTPLHGYALVDPLCDWCRFGELPPPLRGGRALVVLPGGTQWVDVRPAPPQTNLMVTEVYVALAADGALDGNLHSELAGVAARQLRGAEDGGADNGAVAQALFGLDARVRVAVEDVEAGGTSRKLIVRASVRGAVESRGYERYLIRPADFAGVSLNQQWRGGRRQDVLLDAPAWFETTAAVELPVGYQAEVRPPVKVVLPFAEYAAGFSQKERRLHYSRRLVLKSARLSSAQWREFRRFVDDIQALERTEINVWLAN